ncbi:hypothetical protein AKJ09_04217 [Labilithrix luteola]|uniref:Uncharacterized protein n=1 Tax=Labilithrix luteola TaxID=1391654 RepID=A0A0K1PVJ5_9BACT|nr:hypothetical protein AKJ09_04217 [Labilithrix luteola]
MKDGDEFVGGAGAENRRRIVTTGWHKVTNGFANEIGAVAFVNGGVYAVAEKVILRSDDSAP